jgi:cyanophycin synthetase
MNIRASRFLYGPNIWAACPVLEFVLVGDEPDRAAALIAETLRLQEIAGTPVRFSVLRQTTDALLAAVEFAEESVAREALRLAASSQPPGADDIESLRKLPVRTQLQWAVATSYDGARNLGIPVDFLHREYRSYLILGQGSKQHRIRVAEPDIVSGVGRLASTDKHLTKELLRSVGVPVPRGKLLAEGDDPWAAANELGLPVAIKPFDCDMQIGVSLDLRTQDRIEAAFRLALENSYWAMVERFAPGLEHRVIVVGDRVVAVTRIDPPLVVGDGTSTVAQLVEQTNRDPRRGEKDSDGPLYKLHLDEVAEAVLASQGMTSNSTPLAGQKVLVRRDPPYFKNGGNLADLTDVIHPTTAAQCVAAAAVMQIPVAGIDVVALDIARPLEEQEGVVVEVNSNPGLWLHLAPWADSPRPVGEDIVAWLFRGSDGRIPVVALVGDHEKTVQRHLAGLLKSGGRRVGTAGPGEMSSDGRRWPTESMSPQDRAHMLFRNPDVDVALFETDAGELLGHGFASDRCDVAVLLSPPPRGEEPQFVRALTHALGSKGRFVTTSAWPLDRLGVPASQVVLLAGPDEIDIRNVHAAAGGRVVYVRGQDVIVIDGPHSEIALGRIAAKLSPREHLERRAAAAAAWSLGLAAEIIAAHLASFA